MPCKRVGDGSLRYGDNFGRLVQWSITMRAKTRQAVGHCYREGVVARIRWSPDGVDLGVYRVQGRIEYPFRESGYMNGNCQSRSQARDSTGLARRNRFPVREVLQVGDWCAGFNIVAYFHLDDAGGAAKGAIMRLLASCASSPQVARWRRPGPPGAVVLALRDGFLLDQAGIALEQLAGQCDVCLLFTATGFFEPLLSVSIGCPALTCSPDFTAMSMISPLVSVLSSTPRAARMVPTVSSSDVQIADRAVAAAIVTGGGVKSVLFSAENLLYR